MKIVNRIKAFLDRIFNPTMVSSTKAEMDLYEAMYQDFLKSKPVITGIDLAEPGSERTVIYTQPARRQGKTMQQEFRERGVADMAAARRGEVSQPARRETKMPVQSGSGYPARSSSQSTTVFNAYDTNLWASSWGSSSSDSCSSDSCSSDSSSSDCSCGGSD